MRVRSAATILSTVSIAWLLISIYIVAVTSQPSERYSTDSPYDMPLNQPEVVIRAGRLPYEPSNYWVLTNSTPCASRIMEVVQRGGFAVENETVKIQEFLTMLNQEGHYFEYQSEYYVLGVSLAPEGPGTYLKASARLPYEPSRYWVLTNSTPAAQYVIKAIRHPETPILVAEQDGALLELIGRQGGNVKYEGEYYGLGFSFLDIDTSPNGILIQPLSLAATGFFVLGICWISLGLIKFKQNRNSPKALT